MVVRREDGRNVLKRTPRRVSLSRVFMAGETRKGQGCEKKRKNK
jgi:hypothetical protein